MSRYLEILEFTGYILCKILKCISLALLEIQYFPGKSQALFQSISSTRDLQ